MSLQSPALGELLDLLEHERRLVAGPRVLVPTAHFLERRIAFGRGGIPVLTLPVRSQELSERIADRKAQPWRCYARKPPCRIARRLCPGAARRSGYRRSTS